MPLPAVLTIQSGINQLRYATLKGIMAAKKKEIRKAARARGRWRRGRRSSSLYVPEKTKKTQLIQRVAGRSREGARAQASRGSAGDRMILVDCRTARRQAESRDLGNDRGRAAAGEPDSRSPIAMPGVRARSAAGAAAELAAAHVDRGRHRRERRARAVHARRLHGRAAGRHRPAEAGDRRSCRTPIRRATSRRSWPRGWTARSSPTSRRSRRPAARPRSCGRCSRAS